MGFQHSQSVITTPPSTWDNLDDRRQDVTAGDIGTSSEEVDLFLGVPVLGSAGSEEDRGLSTVTTRPGSIWAGPPPSLSTKSSTNTERNPSGEGPAKDRHPG